MELGLDHFEGHRWRGLNHHVTLLMIAHAFLTLEQARAHRRGRAVVLPTSAEMRRRTTREVLARILQFMVEGGAPEDQAVVKRVLEWWLAAG